MLVDEGSVGKPFQVVVFGGGFFLTGGRGFVAAAVEVFPAPGSWLVAAAVCALVSSLGCFSWSVVLLLLDFLSLACGAGAATTRVSAVLVGSTTVDSRDAGCGDTPGLVGLVSGSPVLSRRLWATGLYGLAGRGLSVVEADRRGAATG